MKRLCYLAYMIAGGSPLFAQTAAELAAAQAAVIEREQAQQEALQPPDPPTGQAQQAPDLSRGSAAAICLEVNTIDVAGVTLVSNEKIDNAIAPLKGECLGLVEINSVLEAITFSYVEAGYIAARAYLPEQDLSDGQLDIVVVEGSLEAIVMNGDRQAQASQRTTAFPGMLGEPVNLRDIEQGLDQLSRLRSVDATMQVAAGSEQGDSVLAVNRNVGRRWHGSFDIDDQGSTTTGEYQSRLSFGYDDLLGLNDTLSLTFKRSMDGHPLAFSKDRPNGNTWTAKFEVPYGYWTFGLDGNRNAYQSEIEGALGPIETSGNSRTTNLRISRVLHRNQTSKTTLAGTLTAKETESFILGSRIDVSSRKLSLFNLDLSHSRQIWGGQGSASLGVTRGLDIWDAFDDNTAPDGSPVGQFSKLDLSLGFSRNFEIQSQPITYDGQLTAQWSNDHLFGSEQTSLGGHSSIRGTKEAILFGNRGVILRNEFSMPTSALPDPKLAKMFGSIVPYFAYDIGRIAPQPAFEIPGGTVSGAGIGLRSQGGRIFFDISYSDLLSLPDNLSTTKSSGGVFAASLSISF